MTLFSRIVKQVLHRDTIKHPDLRLVKYNSLLYIKCCNLLLENGFTQTGNYCFTKKHNGNLHGSEHKFFLYHFYTDGLTLNTYFPKQNYLLIKNVSDMQKQIDFVNSLTTNN